MAIRKAIMQKKLIELDEHTLKATGIQHHAGYLTPFTRAEAAGAWPNGTQVIKARSDPNGDRTPNGTLGIVLGSLSAPGQGNLYFVEWDNSPRMVIACVEAKLERIV